MPRNAKKKQNLKTEPAKNDPHFRLDVNFVPYGYQADIYLNGHHFGSECRDFGDDYKIGKLVQEFYERIQKTIDEFRKDK